MSNNADCAAYFKANPAYRRCFKEFWKKWRSYGKTAGFISLKQCTEDEKRAIGGILGKSFYENDIRFSFAEFEQCLQKTKFAPVDMKDLLELYFGRTLSTHQEQQNDKKRRQTEFFDRIFAYIEKKTSQGTKTCQWILAMRDTKAYGYQLLMREYTKDEKQAERLLTHACDALMIGVEADGMTEEKQLAVFAADVTGNPHYFDRGSTAGQLLMHGICYGLKIEIPQTAHRWRDVLLMVGIVADTISSMIHAYGLHLQTETGWHPAYEAFNQIKQPCVVTLENLHNIIGAKAENDKVYIVENEMVFTYLISAMPEKKVTILCTSGQPRAVAIRIMQMLADSGAMLYYSGDIDPDGLAIADRLWTMYGEHLHIWRMGPEEYEKSMSSEVIGPSGAAKLRHMQNPQLNITAEVVAERTYAGYQENIRDLLLEDIKKAPVHHQA